MPQTLNIEQKLADLLDTKDFHPEMMDADGNDDVPANEAKIFKFDYRSTSGNNYGTMVVVLGNDNEMCVMYGDNLGRSIEDPADREEFYNFQHQLTDLANRNRWTSTLMNINQLKKVASGIAAIKEGLFEGYYGTRRTSYQGQPTEARLMIKHNKLLGENDARFRYVESVFIETADSERFKLPFTNMTGARAMLEHVRQGGKPYDIRGCHIAEIVTEVAVLSRFNRATANKLLEGNTQEIAEKAKHYHAKLKESLKSIGSKRGYHAYFETWHPLTVGEEESLVEDIKNLFIEQTIDVRIEKALPILARLQQQDTAMKEADIFENWANHIVEGTWALPDTPESLSKLKELMAKELVVGPDATNATEQLYDLVGDDQLFDRLGELAKQSNGRANVWDDSEVMNRLQELGIDTTDMAQEPAGDEQVPAVPDMAQTGAADGATVAPQAPQAPVTEADVTHTFEESGCNTTMEGVYCPEHGLAECGTVAGSMAPVMGEDQGEAMEDSHNDNPVVNAIARRILMQRPDLLQKHGPEAVGQAIDDVAAFAGSTDEIGSSDVSAWVQQVEDNLTNNSGVAESNNDPMNYNAAITGSYYESQDPLIRIKELALRK